MCSHIIFFWGHRNVPRVPADGIIKLQDREVREKMSEGQFTETHTRLKKRLTIGIGKISHNYAI